MKYYLPTLKKQKTNTMNTKKYVFLPTLEDDSEEKSTPDNKEQQTPLLAKKMEQLFLDKRSIYFWGVVDDKSAKEIVAKLLLLEADKPGEEIKLYINSPGGSVTAGMVVYDTIQLISSPVSTICMGLAASMGSILLSVGAKGRRFIFPHGEVMIHQPSLGGYYQATSADIEIQAIQMEKTKLMGAKILAENCGKTVEQILKDFDRDYWMDADEAIAYGIADAVVTQL
jgi:ATP-dependent Clp protease, protease subunit